MESNKLMIFDGNSVLNRAFYGIRSLTNSEGLFTNAIYGFLTIYLKFIEEENPNYVCVAFDMRAPTFRHKEYEQYKAKRKQMPDELAVQLPVLKQVLEAMNIKLLQKEGYEADDIIGTISKLCEENDMNCVVVTGDKDSLQLASQKTKIKIPITRGGKTETDEYNDNAVFEKYGVTPEQFIDVKGLMGDPSDNIPGVAGIGEKTALSLIIEHKSIEEIYSGIDSLGIKPGVKEKLINNKDMAFLSRRLSKIDRNVPMDFVLNEYIKEEYNKEELLNLLSKLEFKSLIQRFNLRTDVNVIEKYCEYKHITSAEELPAIIQDIKDSCRMTYMLYKDDKGSELEISAVALLIDGVKGKESYSVYIDVVENSNFINYLTVNDVIGALKPLFEDDKVQKIGHSIKDDIVILRKYDVKLEGIDFDTMIAAYIVNPSRNSYEIDELALEFLGISLPSKETILGKGKKSTSIRDIDKKEAMDYACTQVSVLLKLVNVLKEKITKFGQDKLYYDIELPLIEVLAEMQIEGIKVDKQQLIEFSKMLENKVTVLQQEIYNISGEEFNINSPKQLGVVLFENLSLPVARKIKTGYSTDIEVLEKLKDKHAIIDLIIEYRQLVKLKSTYADGLLAVINDRTGKIHSSFNQTVTVTGRISSTEPNLQNIPIKLELGREIRKMFIASSDEYVLVDADYSQIELRILAHISNDENMINAFSKEQDIHTTTASQVFGVPLEDVTSLMRSRAKAVNFGIVYGIGDFSLSQDLGITKKEAKKYIDGYLEKYSKVKQYMTDIVEQSRKDGYVTTITNRIRYVPEINSSNFIVRSSGERMSMNTPIQGSAADIIKIAMVNVYNELKKQNLKSKLILQVHDELLVETHISEIDIVKDIVQSQMLNAAQLKVPLTVDINAGKSWYDAK